LTGCAGPPGSTRGGPQQRRMTLRTFATRTLSVVSGRRQLPVADPVDCTGICWHGTAERRTLVTMNSASAWNRRHLPSSPFKPPPEDPPVEQYEVDDLVTHDKYGLGRVIEVDSEASVVVDFAPRKVRITTPFARMTKL
jgi:hypothetical protein